MMKLLLPAAVWFGAALGAKIAPKEQQQQYQPYKPPKYTTTTLWEDCTTESTFTTYSRVTKTTCPLCTTKHTTKAPPHTTPKPPPPYHYTTPKPPPRTTHTTKYTTVYEDICSTGFTKTRYVVTETCTGPTPSFPTRHPSYVPPGFTKTVTVCTVCGEKPVTATLTVPCTTTPKAKPPPPPKNTKPPGYKPPPPPGKPPKQTYGKPPGYKPPHPKPTPCKNPPCRPTYHSSQVHVYPPPPTHYMGTKNAAVPARPTGGVVGERGVVAVVGGVVAAVGAVVL